MSAEAERGEDPYDGDYDDYAGHCWQCDGEGFVYGCSWDWQCDTYDPSEGTCLCARRCDVCRPAKPVAVLSDHRGGE